MSESVDALRRRKLDEAVAMSGGKAALWANAEALGRGRDLTGALSGGGVVRCVRGEPAKIPAAQAFAVITDPLLGGVGMSSLGAWRACGDLPILWWDHVVDPVQIAQARVAGADGVRITLALLDDVGLDDCLTGAERARCISIVVVRDDEEARRALSMGAEILAAPRASGDRWRDFGAAAVLDIVSDGISPAPGADAVIVGSAE